jgi:hypothetical protein
MNINNPGDFVNALREHAAARRALISNREVNEAVASCFDDLADMFYSPNDDTPATADDIRNDTVIALTSDTGADAQAKPADPAYD